MGRPYTLEDVQRVIANSDLEESKKTAQLKVTEPRPYTVEDVERVIARNKERNTQQKPVTGELWERAPKSSTEIPYVRQSEKASEVPVVKVQPTIKENAEEIEKLNKSLAPYMQEWDTSMNRQAEKPMVIPSLDEGILSAAAKRISDKVNEEKIPTLSYLEGLQHLKGYADIDTMLLDDYKMSKEERAYAKQLYKDYMADFSKKMRSVKAGGTGELSQAEASRIMLDPESDYQKLTRLNNKASSMTSFATGLFSSMPFADSLMKKGDEMLEEQFGEQYGMSEAVKDAELQNAVAAGAGKFVGNAALYQTAGGIMEQIPGVSALKSKVAGGIADLLGGGAKAAAADPVAAAARAGFANAVGNSTANILSDLTLDVGLDTVPHVVSDVQEGKGTGEVAKNALGNVGMNLLYNAGGEAVSHIPVGKLIGKAKSALGYGDDATKGLDENLSLIKALEQPTATSTTEQIAEPLEQLVEDSTKTIPQEYLSGEDFSLEDIAKVAQRNPDIPKSILPSSSKFAKADKDMSKLVKWYGNDDTVKYLEDFRKSLSDFENTGSLADFRGVEEAVDQIEKAIKGKTYTSPDLLNKNGTLKRKGVTYTYGDAGNIDDVLDEMMDAVEEVYVSKKVAADMQAGTFTISNAPELPVVKPENNFTSTGNETAEDLWKQLEAGDITKNTNEQMVQKSFNRETGPDPLNSQGKLKEESYSQNISKGRVENVSPEIQNTFINEPSVYQTLSNAETVQRAQQIYDSGQAEHEIYRMLDVKDPASIPLGNKIMSDLIDGGRSDEAVELLRTMSSKLRESGQFTQAAAITMMKSDPDTALRYAVREIDSLNMAGRKKYGGKWRDFILTDDEIKSFRSIQAGDTDAIKKAYEQIGARLAKEYPSTKWEKVVELSRVGMLLNPRTQVRNVVSNAMLQPVRSLSDRVSALGQNAIHLINPDFKVTQSLVGGGREEKKVAGEVWDSVKDSLLGESSKWDKLKGIGNEKQVFHGSPISKVFDKIFPGAIERANKAMGKNVDDSILETIRNFTYYLLERGDEPFVKNNFVNRLASYMKAQGIKSIDEIPEEAITLAKDEALKATFKDDNSFTRALTGIKQNTGKLGEVVMPFTKTPANLAMRGIDYSPTGLVSTFKSAKNGADAAKIMDDLSKNLVGSAAIFGGYELAKHGIITGKLSSDKDEAAFQKQQGQLAYSIRVGDHYYTYDWAQPAAIPFILGASIFQSVEESDQEESDVLRSLKAIGNAAYNGGTSAVNAWADLSPLQSFQDLFSGSYGSEGFAENLGNELLEYPQRLIPSWLGATARTLDTTQRQTYSAGNPIQTQIDTAISKIPVLSETLPAAYDTWGREIKRNNSIGEAAFAQMFNPGQLGNVTTSPIDGEIQRLYDITEDKAVFPQKSSWTVGGKKLSNREYSDLQKEQGNLSYDMTEAFINSPSYSSMEDSMKAKTIADIYALTKALAENSVVGKDIPKTQQKIAGVYKDQGIDMLIPYLMMNNNLDYNGDGHNKKEDVLAFLDDSSLTPAQKAYLFATRYPRSDNPYK